MNCPKCNSPISHEPKGEKIYFHCTVCEWNDTRLNEARKCDYCGNMIEYPTKNQKYCSKPCQNAVKNRVKAKRNKEMPLPPVLREGTVFFDPSKNLWVAETPRAANKGNRKRFYSRNKEKAIQKRKDYLSEGDGLFQIFQEFSVLCERYGLTPKEFFTMTAHFYQEDEQ